VSHAVSGHAQGGAGSGGQTAPARSLPGEGFINKHYFLLRRLHSLSGVAPIGVFLFPHLTTNSSVLWGLVLGKTHYVTGDGSHAGVETFQHEVNFIHSLPALQIIEWSILFIPIIFHAVLGLYFARTGMPNVRHYNYQDNWRYTLQRTTGYIGIVYLFMHITSLRFGWEYFGLMPTFDANFAASTTAVHFQTYPWIVPLVYLIGVMSLVFHFANGLWTAAITWGLTVSVKAQQRWGYVCAAIGVGLAGAGLAAIVGFTTLDPAQARHIEEKMLQGHPAGVEQAEH